MAWFGQGRDTIEWDESRSDVLCYKWPAKEIKKGSHLIIRPGQKAIFYANGIVEGVFAQPGNFDIDTEITPFLSTLKGWVQLRGDTGMRAEVYFINTKQVLVNWGTRQRIMIPTPEVPTGIPVGMNGNVIVKFDDDPEAIHSFIASIAGVKDEFTIEDISERIMGKLNAVIAGAILNGQTNVPTDSLINIQANSLEIGNAICGKLDEITNQFGMDTIDLTIADVNYPEDVMKMAEQAAATSFVGDVGKFAAVQMAQSFNNPDAGGNVASAGAQMGMGLAMAQQMGQAMNSAMQQPQTAQQAAPQQGGDRFCPKCRKMVSGKFCSDCGTPTV
ncbi:MAG: SPFH domain-containing protein [Clostridiales bacterium]|nr:SPFH domain-containing protein [Clostridiales bacterium]